MSIACPVCQSTGPHKPIRRHTVDQAVAHYGPSLRRPTPEATAEALDRMRAVIRDRWQQDFVEVWECPNCQFGFSVPYVDAGKDFFSLFLATPHYPRDRWEFSFARDLIRAYGAARPDQRIRVLEIGGGDGAFIRQVLAEPSLAGRVDPMVCDYSPTAVARLNASGIEAGCWSLDEMRAHPKLAAQCDFVCSYHCIDEIADLDGLFSAMHSFLKPGGRILISTKNGDRIEHDEQVLGMPRMLPMFVGRWFPSCVAPIATRHHLEVVEVKFSDGNSLGEIWYASKLRALGDRSLTSGLARMADRIPLRPLRGAIKLSLAALMLPATLLRGKLPPSVLFMHLRRPEQ